MAISGAKITDQHIIFPTVAKAEEFAASCRECAEEGETYVVIPNPIEGKNTAIVALHFNGEFECYC